jgi:hypothetical protein
MPTDVINAEPNVTNIIYLSYADINCLEGFVFPDGSFTKEVQCVADGAVGVKWTEPEYLECESEAVQTLSCILSILVFWYTSVIIYYVKLK